MASYTSATSPVSDGNSFLSFQSTISEPAARSVGTVSSSTGRMRAHESG
jgi:hypothetical protein